MQKMSHLHPFQFPDEFCQRKLRMLKHDAGDKKMSVWGEQNFDENKNNQI